MSLELPVKPGDVLWLAEHNSYLKTEKCSVCCGHKSVWVRNIEGDEYEVRCEACGKGYEDVPGVEQYWAYDARATRFEVSEIKSVEFTEGSPKIYVESTGGRRAYVHELYTTEENALMASQISMDRLVRSNMAARLSAKKSRLPEHAWSVRYHGDCIRRAQKEIEWHSTRLLNKKSRSKKHDVSERPSSAS